MKANEYLALYEKYINGQCTFEEKALLMSYKDKFNFIENFSEAPLTQEELKIKSETYAEIKSTLNLNKSVFKLSKWWSAAAAITIIAGAALFINKRQTPIAINQQAQNVKKAVQQVKSNKSPVLTLGDGSIIALNNVKDGTVLSNGNAAIKKLKDGTLLYEPVSDNNTPVVYNTITIPRGNQYQIVLPDGTNVWLNSESTLTYPTKFTGNERNVKLIGEGYFEVTKNKKMPFKVAANGTEIEVLGTHFNISAYKDDEIVKTTLLEGSVKLSNDKTQALIKPGQQGVLSGDSFDIKIEQAKIDEAMAWKNGYFIFHDENIVNIMKKVSRWYDVDVEYKGNVKNYEFGGSISKYSDITGLLHIMELTHTIHYKIEGRRVIIMK
jgi:transmembrane sensor